MQAYTFCICLYLSVASGLKIKVFKPSDKGLDHEINEDEMLSSSENEAAVSKWCAASCPKKKVVVGKCSVCKNGIADNIRKDMQDVIFSDAVKRFHFFTMFDVFRVQLVYWGEVGEPKKKSRRSATEKAASAISSSACFLQLYPPGRDVDVVGGSRGNMEVPGWEVGSGYLTQHGVSPECLLKDIECSEYNKQQNSSFGSDQISLFPICDDDMEDCGGRTEIKELIMGLPIGIYRVNVVCASKDERPFMLRVWKAGKLVTQTEGLFEGSFEKGMGIKITEKDKQIIWSALRHEAKKVRAEAIAEREEARAERAAEKEASAEEWHLAPAGSHECDFGTSANQEQCEELVEAFAAKAGKTPGRGLQIGQGGRCLDGSWGQVPLGCSAQSGKCNRCDWAAHFKTAGDTGDGCIKDYYQLVCSGSPRQ